jgi:predicted RNase H-like HicB family nuclease
LSKERDKERHEVWYHPFAPDTILILAGDDDDDAKPYQERDVRQAIAAVQQLAEFVVTFESLSEWTDGVEDETSAASHYALLIEWSAEDDAFVVSVPDIPGLHTHGATREEAASMGDEAVALWLACARGNGVSAPRPAFSALPASDPRKYDA